MKGTFLEPRQRRFKNCPHKHRLTQVMENYELSNQLSG